MKKAVVLVVILVIAFGVLHLYSASRIAAQMKAHLEDNAAEGVFEVDVNPFSNTGVFTFSAGSGPPPGTDATSLEAGMAAAARGRLDLFAMLSPYKAKIVVRKSGSWLTQAKMSTNGKLWSSPAAETAGQSPLATLRRDTPLMVLSATGGVDGKWVQVRTEGGLTGWVREKEMERD